MTLHSSPMGRGGHRDDRRRRLLAEDLTASSGLSGQDIASPATRNGQPHAHKSENYGDAQFLQTESRLTDLIPRRLVSYLLLLKVGLAAIAGLVALYIWTPDLLLASQPRPAIADLGNCGSLGNWFGSVLLLIASLLAIIIYRIRRHKVDDYRGHYHVWLWAAACWFLMATNISASLHQGFQQLMISLSGRRIAGDGSLWWVIPAVLLVGSMGTRLLVDMWSSRLSSIALILSATAYLTALAGFFRVIVLQSEVSELLLVQGAVLGGHLLLALSMGLHARYVVLDAEGGLAKRSQKKKAEKKRGSKKSDPGTTAGQAGNLSQVAMADRAAQGDASQQGSSASGEHDADHSEEGDEEADDEQTGDSWVAADPPHSASQPILKRVTPPAASAVPPLAQKMVAPGAGSPAAGTGAGNGELSKADRKALKRKLLDERLKREQQKSAKW